MERKKDKLDEKEKELDEDVEKKATRQFLVAQELLETAKNSLTSAINDGNMTCMAAANELVTAAQKKYQEYTAYKSAKEPIKRKKHL